MIDCLNLNSELSQIFTARTVAHCQSSFSYSFSLQSQWSQLFQWLKFQSTCQVSSFSFFNSFSCFRSFNCFGSFSSFSYYTWTNFSLSSSKVSSITQGRFLFLGLSFHTISHFVVNSWIMIHQIQHPTLQLHLRCLLSLSLLRLLRLLRVIHSTRFQMCSVCLILHLLSLIFTQHLTIFLLFLESNRLLPNLQIQHQDKLLWLYRPQLKKLKWPRSRMKMM